jgi:hypothetical protein
MTSHISHRGFAADLEVRSGGDGRTVYGIACPFNSPAPINEWGVRYTEQFASGAFARTIAHQNGRVKFLAQHDQRAFPLGVSEVLREDAAGLYGEFRVSKTERGDEALELIRDGALDGFSIGFSSLRSDPMQPRNDAIVTRQEVRLIEVSAVSFPAYADALMGGVRAEDAERLAEFLDLLRADADPAVLARLDEVAGLAELQRAGKQLSTASMATLQTVLDHIAAADKHVDAAQPVLAALMGVKNPDEDEDGTDDSSGDVGDADGIDDDNRAAHAALLNRAAAHPQRTFSPEMYLRTA